MGWIRKRGNEPSTHAGLAAVAQGLKLLAPQWSMIFDLVTMAFGTVAAMKADPVAK